MKAYYTSGIVYDVLQTFGELSEEALQNRKYAKYKAAYIHNCLKNGETPIPGPHNEDGTAAEGNDDNEDVVVGGGSSGERPSSAESKPATPPEQPSTSQPQTPNVDDQPTQPTEPFEIDGEWQNNIFQQIYVNNYTKT